MGMLIPSIGDRCQALLDELANCPGPVTVKTTRRAGFFSGPVISETTAKVCGLSFPRPGPQIPTRRCEHAAGGCNYPEGDCAGLCLVVKPAKAA